MHQLEGFRRIQRHQKIEGWNIRIYYWSRDLRILAAVGVAIVAIGVYLAWRWSAPGGSVATEVRSEDRPVLSTELAKSPPDLLRVATAMRAMRFRVTRAQRIAIASQIQKSALLPADKKVAAAYWESMVAESGEPSADLLYYAHYVHPLPYANELVGDLFLNCGQTEKAADYYGREATFFASLSARQKEIAALTSIRDFDRLGKLGEDPAYAPLISSEAMQTLRSYQRRWGDLGGLLWKMQREMMQPVPLVLALTAGLVWMLVLVQAIQPPGIFSVRALLPWLGVCAGVLSTFPTLLAVYWEEELFGLRLTGTFFGDLRYFLLGVGPREELIKLIFFLPFIPLLWRRKSMLEVLIVAGSVGLGFAISENLLYFEKAGTSAAFARVLTANFFHLAATAVIGCAFFELLQQPLKSFFRSFVAIVSVVLAHGLYDAFFSVAELQVLEVVSMVVFLVLSLFFFRRLREFRDGSTDQFSIAATLVGGLAVLIATLFVSASQSLGLERAAWALAPSCTSLAMVVYMFYWQLGEGLSGMHSRTHSRLPKGL